MKPVKTNSSDKEESIIPHDYLERITSNAEEIIKSDGKLYRLSAFPAIEACACTPAFAVNGLRKYILDDFTQSLSGYDPQDTIHLSIAGSGLLFETTQILSQCVIKGYKKIKLDLFDLRYIAKEENKLYIDALGEFYSLFERCGVQLSFESGPEIDSKELLQLSDLKKQAPSEKIADIQVRIFGDVAKSSVLASYQKEPHKRIIIACDFVEHPYNPFPILRKMKKNVANGSSLIIANKHGLTKDVSRSFTWKTSVFYFSLKKNAGTWGVNQSAFLDINTGQVETGAEEKYQYLIKAAETDAGPKPHILDKNRGHGPYADWGRFFSEPKPNPCESLLDLLSKLSF